MVNGTVICKVARLAQSNEQQKFEYCGKSWCQLDFLNKDMITKLLAATSNVYENLILKEVKNDTDDTVNLAAVYVANKPGFLKEELLEILYKNYTKNSEAAAISQGDNNSNATKKLRSKYLTTQLYDFLWQTRDASVATVEGTLQQLPKCFQPTLCRYQARAVLWMLQREQQPVTLPPLYMQLLAKDNEHTFYKHLHCSELRQELPPPIVLPPGGILADEMGLGKTVEVLALIVSHKRANVDSSPPFMSAYNSKVIPKKKRRHSTVVFCVCGNPDKITKLVMCVECCQMQHETCVSTHNSAHDEDINNPYICPLCWELLTSEDCTNLVKTSATLLVTPKPIRNQWLTEMKRHIKPRLRVLVYEGLVGVDSWISPRQLADYDVVITEYNVLRQEVYHTSQYASGRVSRNKPRYMRLPSPLLMVQWWRVCIDEAQMIESNTTKLTAMVHILPAVNRWAITGTPIQRSLDDLRSLLKFIGFNEACEPLAAWNNLVQNFVLHHKDANNAGWRLPLINDVLRHCMWRTSKPLVVDELHIPPQEEVVHYIQLSNLEELFYMEQHNECKKQFDVTVNKHLQLDNGQTSTISPKFIKFLLQPLLKLRQICNMPVIIDAKHGWSATTQKHFLQPMELHTHLKSTNELECKSAVRSMVSSYNGIAAVHYINENYDEAIRHYELALKLADDYKDTNYSVDSLLQIHALHNVMQAYYCSPKYVKRQLPVDKLQNYEQQCYKLEWHYLKTYADNLFQATTASNRACDGFNSVRSELRINVVQFLANLMQIVQRANNWTAEKLMDKLDNDFQPLFADQPKLNAKYSLGGVLYIVQKWWTKVHHKLEILMEEFSDLQFFTQNVRARNKVSIPIWRQIMQFNVSVYDCHLSELREGAGKKNAAKSKEDLCKLCNMKNHLNELECLIYKKVIDKETNLTEGLALPSTEILLVKAIMSYVKSNHLAENQLTNIDIHLESIERLQVVVKTWIKYWIEIEYTVKAYDELDMCKMRVSLTDNEQEKNNYRITQYELGNFLMEQQMNLHEAQQQFIVKLARLKYIMHLEQHVDPGVCPICQNDDIDNSRYAVLECGHHICLMCLKSMCQLAKKTTITCAVCRNQQSSQKLYFVTRTSNKPETDEIQVAGNFSSKITLIVHTILRLCQEQQKSKTDPPKVLIFSQWHPILLAISSALTENDIIHRKHCSPLTLAEFKNPNLGVICLLMTYSQGSNGLNLIEANHVFLVEPILNPGVELQAIGRIHRFGQTKPTTVHRFIVKSTIEESVYNVVTSGTKAQSSWEFDESSVDNLRNLFDIKNEIPEAFTG